MKYLVYAAILGVLSIVFLKTAITLFLLIASIFH